KSVGDAPVEMRPPDVVTLPALSIWNCADDPTERSDDGLAVPMPTLPAAVMLMPVLPPFAIWIGAAPFAAIRAGERPQPAVHWFVCVVSLATCSEPPESERSLQRRL